MSSTSSSPSPTAIETSPGRPQKTLTHHGFPIATIDLIVKKLTEKRPTDEIQTITTDVTDLVDAFQASSFEDFQFFEWKDIEDEIDNHAHQTRYKLLSKPLYKKKLSFIVRFAKLAQPLDDTHTIHDIRQLVDAVKQPPTAHHTPTGSTPTSKSALKIEIPDVPEWDGDVANFFSWKERAMDTLGQAGILKYVVDASAVTQEPDIAQAVFFALRKALSKGTAQTSATQLLQQGKQDPMELWKRVTDKFETPANKAGFLLKAIKNLIDVRLDSANTASQFISDFQDILFKLMSYGAGIVKDEPTLRAILLRAIQDDDYKGTQDYILDHPTCTHHDILKHLENREAALTIRDGEPPIRQDGIRPSILRRQKTISFSEDTSSTRPTWSIPPIPYSWEKGLGKSVFKLLNKWRDRAHGKYFPPTALCREFALDVSTYTSNRNTNNKRKSNDNRSTARRVSNNTTQGTAPEEDTVDVPQQDTSIKRMCVTLRKSNTIITDRPAKS